MIVSGTSARSVYLMAVPPFSSDQSFWLLIRGPGFDSRHYQIFCVAVGLERGSLSIVRINEELLERKVAAPV
jgi:hypothetical protein